MSTVVNRCGCRGSTGIKRSYLSFVEARRAADERQELINQVEGQHGAEPITLSVYPCPVSSLFHLTSRTPEQIAEIERRRRRDWNETKARPELPYTELSKLVWDATTLADAARGSIARSRSDLVELVFHPHQGWQASAPVKPPGRRDRWVRAEGTTAEEAVTKLITAITPAGEEE